MTQLTVVAEYVKLCTHYMVDNCFSKPCTNASLAIAQQIDKDKYFAQHIHEDEWHLLLHGHLSHLKAQKKAAQWMLLDNQDVQKVHVYLAAQK